jgi:hypothetical protein
MVSPTFDYVETTSDDDEIMDDLRGKFSAIEAYILDSLPNCRQRSLALTKLEEAAMWANKAVTHGVEN